MYNDLKGHRKLGDKTLSCCLRRPLVVTTDATTISQNKHMPSAYTFLSAHSETDAALSRDCRSLCACT